jgi:RNA polymerase sigma-70 factor (ECF subfamily)
MPPGDPDAPGTATSVRVRGAIAGDRESLGWIVTRFSPLLRAQAAWRLGPLAGQFDVDDILAEAWMVMLKRRTDLVLDDRRATPRLLAFLGATILNLVNQRIKAAMKQRQRMAPPPEPGREHGGVEGFADTVTGALTDAARGELGRRLDACLSALPEKDRQVVLLRAVEGLTNLDAAHELGEAPNTVSHRYRRAIEKLRAIVPDSLFDELLDD